MFLAYKDLAGFDVAARQINEASVGALHRFEFMNGAQDEVIIGDPRTGKPHAATVLGI
jgi:hypothetical protein